MPHCTNLRFSSVGKPAGSSAELEERGNPHFSEIFVSSVDQLQIMFKEPQNHCGKKKKDAGEAGMRRVGTRGRRFTKAAAMLCLASLIGACQTLPNTQSNASFYVKNNTLIASGIGKNVSQGQMSLHRVRQSGQGYHTIDLRVIKKRFLRRPDQMIIHVDQKPVSFGRLDPQHQAIAFNLPAAVNEPDACYVMVQGNRPQSTKQTLGGLPQDLSPQDYLLNFKPFVQQRQREASLAKLENRLAAEENNAQRLEERIQSAERRLRASNNVDSGSCKWVPPTLPPRPSNYMTARKAKRIAGGIYVGFLAEKYNCSIGFLIAQQVSKENADIRKFVRGVSNICDADAFLAAFGIGFINNKFAQTIPRNEWSPFVDLWEAIVARCAIRGEADCQLMSADTEAARANAGIDGMAQRLLAPTRQWETAVRQAKSQAQQAHSQCKSDRKLVADRVNLTREASLNVSNARRDVALKKQFVADHHRPVFRAADLQCLHASKSR